MINMLHKTHEGWVGCILVKSLDEFTVKLTGCGSDHRLFVVVKTVVWLRICKIKTCLLGYLQ